MSLAAIGQHVNEVALKATPFGAKRYDEWIAAIQQLRAISQLVAALQAANVGPSDPLAWHITEGLDDARSRASGGAHHLCWSLLCAGITPALNTPAEGSAVVTATDTANAARSQASEQAKEQARQQLIEARRQARAEGQLV